MGTKSESVVQIVAGNNFSIGLRRNGKVVFAGDLPAESKSRLQTWGNIKNWSFMDMPIWLAIMRMGALK